MPASTRPHRLSTGDSTRIRPKFTRLAIWQLTGGVLEDGAMTRPNDIRRSAHGRRVVFHGDRVPRRRHGTVDVDDRTVLERAGWRTTLDYRENHRRDADGVLSDIEPRWRGEAEHVGVDGDIIVYSVVGPTPAAVWRRLRAEAEHGVVDERRTVAAHP